MSILSSLMPPVRLRCCPGVLWVIDELHRNEIVPVTVLLDALKLFATDATVRLPAREVAAYIRRYEALRQPFSGIGFPGRRDDR